MVKPAPEDERYNLTVLSGTMADFGSGGFRISTKYILQVGQNVRARVVSGDDQVIKTFPPEAIGEVVWVAPGHDSCTAGLKFLS